MANINYCSKINYTPNSADCNYDPETTAECGNKRRLPDSDFDGPLSKMATTGDGTQYLTSMTSQKNTKRNCEVKTVKRMAQTKKKKIDLTLNWLEENYMICDGICLARCILYNHYLDFCNKSNIEPACAATFGKTIRHKFPLLTTRRLGTRGHSKYHYYGIGIRETSIYYNSVYAGKGLTRFSPTVKQAKESPLDAAGQYPRNCLRRFQDDFPDASQFNDIGEVSHEMIQDFLSYYRGFCERIITAAGTRSFDRIPAIHQSCWEGFSHQYLGILINVVFIDLISLCDIILHQSLTDLLLPTPCENISEMDLIAVRNLGKQWQACVKSSMIGCPEELVAKKSLIAQQFGQSLVRQTSVINLAKTVRILAQDSETVTPMLNDIENIDLKSMGSQAFYANTESEDQDTDLNSELIKELKELLHKRANVDMFVEWLDNIVDQKVIKPSKQNGRSMKKRAQDFLLKWSFFGARIMHTLTINNATSFNSFHYLRMLMDEYILFAVETQFNNEKREEIRNAVTKHIKHTKTSATNSSEAIYSPPTYSCGDSQRSRKNWTQSWTSNVYSPNTQLNAIEAGNKGSLMSIKESDTFYAADTQDFGGDFTAGIPYSTDCGMNTYSMHGRQGTSFYETSSSPYYSVGRPQLPFSYENETNASTAAPSGYYGSFLPVQAQTKMTRSPYSDSNRLPELFSNNLEFEGKIKPVAESSVNEAFQIDSNHTSPIGTSINLHILTPPQKPLGESDYLTGIEYATSSQMEGQRFEGYMKSDSTKDWRKEYTSYTEITPNTNAIQQGSFFFPASPQNNVSQSNYDCQLKNTQYPDDPNWNGEYLTTNETKQCHETSTNGIENSKTQDNLPSITSVLNVE